MNRAPDGTPYGPRELLGRALARGVIRPTLGGPVPLPIARRIQDALGAGAIGGRPKADVRRGSIAGVPVEVVRRPGASDDHLLLYLHGGGFVVGSPRSHRWASTTLATYARATVVVPEYRLSPEHPFPAGADDVTAVYAEVADRDAPRLTVAGDSAGGNLAIGLATARRDAGDDRIDALGLISPWCDLSLPEGSWQWANDPMLDRDGLDVVGGYCAGGHAVDDPRVSPVHADLRDLPPTLAQVGGAEAFTTETHTLANRAAEQGAPLHLQVWPGMWHVHQALVGLLPQADRALRDLGAFLRDGTIPPDARPAAEVPATAPHP
ncbi:alpha/beta hydrolase [Nitriliruptoraceae bacterium ZYF776]|nr:alpha/beta hydrolase [Profundirhabdus halotolerans]